MGGFWEGFGRFGGGLGSILTRFWKGFGESWGRPRKAKKNRAVHTFVYRCAFRSPTRSGLVGGAGHVGLVLASGTRLRQPFLVFGRICVRSGVLKRFFLIWDRFGEDFGSIWGGFGDVLSTIFCIFIKIAIL